jgi:hypothetical protein
MSSSLLNRVTLLILALAVATSMSAASQTLTSTLSRKTHGPSQVLDIELARLSSTQTQVTVEPRVGTGGHQIVFRFAETINSVSGTVATDDTNVTVPTTTSFQANEVFVQLGEVADGRRVTVNIATVNGSTVNVSASIRFKLGDVDGNGVVNGADLASIKSQSGRATTSTTAKWDVTSSGRVGAADIAAVKARAGGTTAPTGPEPGTIMFATQVPAKIDFAGRLSTFGNHRADEDVAPRGGDLMIRYPDGVLRYLTKEAGFGMDGFQGANAIAVREPAVHWSGEKAVFSMIVGSAPVRFANNNYRWQLYEVTGLKRGQTAVVTKVPNQPTTYNNVSPIYGTDDRIIFTSDRPHNGLAHLYPQRDEYESTPTNSGLFSLNPANGDLKLLQHSPSGSFSPSIDSAGRVVFIRWDHLLHDQQIENTFFGAVNLTSEAANATQITAVDIFPEPREIVTTPYGPTNRNAPNFFTPWQINEDGSDEETLNHVGRHELSWTNMKKSFINDTALLDETGPQFRANQISLPIDNGGLFHLREDPLSNGTFYAIAAPEFNTLTADRIVRFNGGESANPEDLAITNMTVTQATVGTGSYPQGRFRNPLPTTQGKLIAAHTPATDATPATMDIFRLRELTLNTTTNLYEPGTHLTSGITKSVSYWDTGTLQTFNGQLWEVEPVEVRVRPKPVRAAPALEAPEAAVFAEEGVNVSTFRNWLTTNNLALIVTRDQTSRDRADFQQPFNLRVAGAGGKTTTRTGSTGRTYDIAHFQIFQGDMVRGYTSRPGRRTTPRPLHDGHDKNVPNPTGPAGSVKIEADGSTAAFVPARRAMVWQTTDAAGEPIVRERFWVTSQPGEIRVCASCHGANRLNQAGQSTPTNKPEALRKLLRAWKLLQ